MASRWAGISDRIRIAPVAQFGWRAFGLMPSRWRPPGVDVGRWTVIGPFWVRLGSRASWADEDLNDQMIKPVEP